MQELIFGGPVLAFAAGIVAAIFDRPKKRAVIGLSISFFTGVSFLAVLVVGAVSAMYRNNDTYKVAAPGVNVSTETTWYDVTGSTAAELRAQMDALGPDGYDAGIKYPINWKYQYVEDGDGCAIGEVQVDVAITETYPRWDPAPDVPKDLRGTWDAHLLLLESHEYKHREIAMAAGHEIYETLQGLPSSPTCDELGKKANTIALELYNTMEERQNEFDRESGHGAREGARFP